MATIITPLTPDKDEKRVSKIILEINRNNLAPEDLSESEVPFLYRQDMLEGIIDSMKRHGQYHFLSDFGKELGQSFIDMLKTRAERWYSKSVQNPADIVWAIAGAKENDWYLSLLEKDVHQVVRLTAIEALQGCKENTPVLLHLYKKGKAAEKQKALEALAVINPPEAEPIWEKIIENGKPEFLYYVLKCQHPICMEYKKKQLEQATEELFLAEDDVVCNKLNQVTHLCNVTSDEEELFLKIARANLGESVIILLNRKLIYELHKEDAKKLTCSLFALEPELFFLANAFLNLIENPVEYFATVTDISIDKRKQLLEIVAQFLYIPYKGKYFTSKISGWPYPWYPLFEEIPDSLLHFLQDDSYLQPAPLGSTKHQEIYEYAEQACEALWRLSSPDKASKKDLIKVQSVAEDFAVKVAHAGYTGFFCMEIIERNPDILKGQSREILTTYAHNRMAIKSPVFTEFDRINRLSMTKEEKLFELYDFLNSLKEEAGGTVYWLKRTIEDIEKND